MAYFTTVGIRWRSVRWDDEEGLAVVKNWLRRVNLVSFSIRRPARRGILECHGEGFCKLPAGRS